MALWRDGVWFDKPTADTLRRVIAAGFYIRVDGQVEAVAPNRTLDSPWVFIGEPEQPECLLWLGVYWEMFRLIPSYCRFRCHKVVAFPRSVRQLFDLYVVMRDKIGWPSKCGVDRRPYTSAPYAAFFYNTSMEEGQECYRLVREKIDAHMPDGQSIRVLLKKGCTEMEDALQGGRPTDTWCGMSGAEWDMEAHLDGIFYHGKDDVCQADWHKRYIQFRWLEHAYSIGDQTWKEVLGELPGGINPFGSIPVTYHEKMEEVGGEEKG